MVIHWRVSGSWEGMDQWREERAARQSYTPRLLLQVELSWKDWGGLFYLHSAWDTPRIKLPHLSTGATSVNKFSGNLEAVKGDQMSCLSYCLCSDSEKKAEQEQKLKHWLLCTCLTKRVLSGTGNEGSRIGPGERSKHIDGLSLRLASASSHRIRTHTQSWSPLKQGLAFGVKVSVSHIYRLPLGKEA